MEDRGGLGRRMLSSRLVSPPPFVVEVAPGIDRQIDSSLNHQSPTRDSRRRIAIEVWAYPPLSLRELLFTSASDYTPDQTALLLAVVYGLTSTLYLPPSS